jgi:hypothetical protein
MKIFIVVLGLWPASQPNRHTARCHNLISRLKNIYKEENRKKYWQTDYFNLIQ